MGYWTVIIDDVEDGGVIYSGRSMKKAAYEACHLRGLDGRNSYVVFHHNGKPCFYLDESGFHEVACGIIGPYFK